MIIPSIDLMDGQSVQLVGGEASSRSTDREYGDPIPLARKFRLAGDIAVIDLDRAFGKGNNAETIKKLIAIAPCRVGGGIRDLKTATEWLDAGAQKIILGTAAKPEILSFLPKNRVQAALDSKDNDVVVEGWTKKTGQKLHDRIRELRDYVGSFLVTFVEREGRLGGTDLERAKEIVEAAGDARVTFAGGITTAEEIAELDRMGADSQVGMAIYTGKLDFADALAAPLISDRPDGLFPTVVADESGRALGLAYSSHASLKEAINRQLATYQSRKRGIWVKGLTSGNTQELLHIALDCDRDAIRFTVRQTGSGFCHLPQWTCFGDLGGLPRLEQLLHTRLKSAPPDSYTKKLYDNPGILNEKIREEAAELADSDTPAEIATRVAEVLYFTMTKMAKAGLTLADIERELDRRALRVTRHEPESENSTDG